MGLQGLIDNSKNPYSGYWDRIILGLGAFAIFSVSYWVGQHVYNAVKSETPQDNHKRPESVIGTSEPDKYIEVNGQRYFSEIDGQSVEDYVRSPQ
jgi:hypothetical protein